MIISDSKFLCSLRRAAQDFLSVNLRVKDLILFKDFSIQKHFGGLGLRIDVFSKKRSCF